MLLSLADNRPDFQVDEGLALEEIQGHMKYAWFSLFLWVPLATSANWTSSGGEIFRDAHNPWFLKNTPVARYCIAVDPSSVSVSEAEVQSRVEDALQYWHAELAKPLLDFPLGTELMRTVEVGTQSFQRTDCQDPTVDLRFLVGYGTLNQAERDYLTEPTRFVGVTVRTDYDDLNLKGKGFVYIASDFGPNRYSPGNSNIIDRAWQSRKLMLLALIHELGHVFGFTHTGTGVMSEVFLEQLMSTGFGTLVEDGPMPAILMPSLDLEDCQLSPMDLQYLNQNPQVGLKCVYLKFDTSLPGLVGTGAEIVVYGSMQEPEVGHAPPPRIKIGTLKRVTLDQLDMKMDPAVYLYLNPKQTVFTPAEIGHLPFFIGPMFQEFGGEALFVPADPQGTMKPAYFNVGPNYFKLFGQQGNRVRPIFESSSIYSFKLIMHP